MKMRNLTKNQRYPVRIPAIPQGMQCTMDIVPFIMRMRYEEHGMLALMDITANPYVPMTQVGGGLVARIPHYYTRGSEISRLLGLINMPHFGWLNKENACTKHLLACFHGEVLWLDRPDPS